MKAGTGKICIAALIIALAAGGPATAQQKADRLAAEAGRPSPVFPGGASSVTEIHGDWTVTCAIRDGGKQCYVSLTLGNAQSGDRLLAVELRAPRSGSAAGSIFAPFGLRLADGVSLHLDDKPFLPALAFSICTEQGCIVPVQLDTGALSGLVAGTSLQFGGVNGATGEPVRIAIPLSGIGSAMNRSAELER